MNQNSFFKYFFFAILFLSLIAAINVGVRRYQYELDRQVVNMALPLHEIQKSAVYAGISLEKYLKTLKNETSLSTIIIKEETLNDYINGGKVTLLKGSEVMNMHRI